ncbi:MAG: DUF2723 domain-containing protein [Candidatus Promineifilaceae bacterium]
MSQQNYTSNGVMQRTRHLFQTRWAAIVTAGVIAFIIYLSTMQVIPNGSPHPYATDVGEIQNALPRWGTLHFPGYPLYSLTGSIFTTILRPFGIQPAAGTSLFSAVWGALSVSLLTALSLAFNVPTLAAVSTSLLYGLATSVWVDASLAEVHTMTVALLLASVLAALQFGRTGKRSTLLWLALLSTQAVLHQRALVFIAPALLLLAWPNWRMIRRNFLPAIGVALAGALIYLYLPLRDWMGAEWTFNAPGTWQGFWTLLLDTKVDRIINTPGTVTEIGTRVVGLRDLLAHDWPLPLLAAGILGLVIAGIWKSWREAGALLMIALVFPLLTTIIWIGRIGDAALAVNLPTYAMAAVGLAIISAILCERVPLLGIASVLVWISVGIYLVVDHRPEVLVVTRDQSATEVITTADGFKPEAGEFPPTFMALWGRDYWALAYAKEYKEKLDGIELVDHNANLDSIFAEQEKIYTLSSTFYLRSFDSWIERFGLVYLSLAAPGVVEIAKRPGSVGGNSDADLNFDLGNDVTVQQAQLEWLSPTALLLTLFWESGGTEKEDYSVAVHLVAADPPASPQDILAQADQAHPVEGWYPVSSWQNGEIIRDIYTLNVPIDADPVAVRLSMYQVGDDGQFYNTEWLSLDIPPQMDQAGDS